MADAKAFPSESNSLAPSPTAQPVKPKRLTGNEASFCGPNKQINDSFLRPRILKT